MPFGCGSTRPSTGLVGIAAPRALRPGLGIRTPACAASGWLAATMPYFVAIRDRPTMTLMFFILHISGVTLRSRQRFHRRNGGTENRTEKTAGEAARRTALCASPFLRCSVLIFVVTFAAVFRF